MTLRRKATATIFGTMTCLCLALAGLLGVRVIRGYTSLEEEETRRFVVQAGKSLQKSIDRIGSTASDWAPWDDIYGYMKGRNPGFITDNLTESSFMNLELGLVALVDPSGRTLWARSFDRSTKSAAPAPRDFEAFSAADPLLRHPDLHSGAAGLMKLSGGGLMIVASRSITTSDFSAPSAGSLVMGRMLDKAEADRLSEQTDLDIAFAPADGPTLAPDFASVLPRLLASDSVPVLPLGHDLIAGYTLLRDIQGKPAAILRVSTDRSIHAQGRRSLLYILLSLGATAILATGLVLLVMDRLVIGRLFRLGADVRRIGDTRDFKARVDERGSDELSALAATFNATLAKLDSAERELRTSLSEKELLLREIHHRVKNNLQIVSSLLSLQSGIALDRHEGEILRESMGRIQSMALIHEFLYRGRQEGGSDLANIGFRDYLHQLSSYLVDAYLGGRPGVRIEILGEQVFLDADTAVTCGLVVNELLSNSLKHAFPGGRAGLVSAAIYPGGTGEVALAVADDGIGFPQTLDLTRTESMGWQLVTTLVSQLKGRIDIDGRDGFAPGTGSGTGGSSVRITFPLN